MRLALPPAAETVVVRGGALVYYPPYSDGREVRLGGIELRDVTANNWRDAVRIEPRDDQGLFVASVAYHLNLCHYGGEWRPLALYRDGEIVGFSMWGFDHSEESHWIGGLNVGAEHQGRG